MFEAISLGLLAAIAPSPHSLALVNMTCSEVRFSQILKFNMTGMMFDLILVAIILVNGQNLHNLESVVHYLKIISFNLTIYLCFKLYLNAEKNIPFQSTHLNGFFIQSVNPNPYMFWFIIGLSYLTTYGAQLFIIFTFIFLLTTYAGKLLMAYTFSKIKNGQTIHRLKKIISIYALAIVNYHFFFAK